VNLRIAIATATALLSMMIDCSNPMAYLNAQRLQNPLELGWLWMLDVNTSVPKRKSNQDQREAENLAQFEAEVEARRYYYQVCGRW
jgi:hypothetical protein